MTCERSYDATVSGRSAGEGSAADCTVITGTLELSGGLPEGRGIIGGTRPTMNRPTV